MNRPDSGLSHILEGSVPAGRVRFFKELDSTNRLAREYAAQGEPAGTLVVADYQTRGRGRLERVWESPPGANLMFSLILRPELKLENAFLLTMAAAVSMARAVERTTGLRPLLKWPNDLFLEGKKLAGVLTELKAGKGRMEWAVVGIGLNTSAHPPGVDSIDLAGRLGSPVDRFAVLKAFLDEHGQREGMDPESLRQEWIGLSYTLGREVTVDDQGKKVTGLALEIDAQGALILETEEGRKRVVCGDLSVEG